MSAVAVDVEEEEAAAGVKEEEEEEEVVGWMRHRRHLIYLGPPSRGLRNIQHIRIFFPKK